PHAFSYANAAFGLITRATDGGVDVETEVLCPARGIPWRSRGLPRPLFQRPPARLPGGDARVLPPAELRRAFLDACESPAASRGSGAARGILSIHRPSTRRLHCTLGPRT